MQASQDNNPTHETPAQTALYGAYERPLDITRVASKDVQLYSPISFMGKLAIFVCIALITVLCIGFYSSKHSSVKGITVQTTTTPPPPVYSIQIKTTQGSVYIDLANNGNVVVDPGVKLNEASVEFWKNITATYPEIMQKVGMQYLVQCGLKDQPVLLEAIGRRYIEGYIKAVQEQNAKNAENAKHINVIDKPVKKKK